MLKCRKNWSEISFRILDPQFGTKKIWTQNSNLFQIGRNGQKIGLMKNQICSKLDEMTRKVVRNYFRILDPPNSPLPPHPHTMEE